MNLFQARVATLLPLVALAAVSALSQSGFAQAVNQQIPRQVDPGLLTPAPAEILTPTQQPTVSPTQQAPQTEIEVPEPPTIVELEASRFQVDHIQVTGNVLVDDESLRLLTQPYEGKEVTLEELGKLVELINAKYREQGYLTSLAYIPPQDVTAGTVQIQVLEGRVGDISVAGNKFYRAWAIARYMDQGSGDPLNIPTLEKNLRRMNRLGDYRVRATLSAGEAPGVTDIRLDVEERQPWQVGLTFDNQGRPRIGTERVGAELINRNVTGIGDRFTARWLGATGTQIAMGSYFVPLNRFGTELGATFSYSYVDVDLGIPNQPEITGTAVNYGLVLSQPLDEEHIWTVDTGVNFRRINSYFNHERSDKDDIRSIQLGLNFDKFDRLGRTFARLQTSFAPQFGNMNTEQFWKTEGIFNRLFRLPKGNFVILRGYTQITPDALPPAEQFQLGGAFSVRGYTEGLLIGDRGYQLSLEHRWPLPGLRRVSPWLADRIQGATFFDFGQTWLDTSNRRFLVGNFNDDSRTMLIGTGLGIRARLTQYLQGFVDFGFGLVNRSAIEPNAQPVARVHFGVRSDLLPDTFKTWGKKETPVQIKPRNKKYVEKRAREAATAETAPASNEVQPVPQQAPVTP